MEAMLRGQQPENMATLFDRYRHYNSAQLRAIMFHREGNNTCEVWELPVTHLFSPSMIFLGIFVLAILLPIGFTGNLLALVILRGEMKEMRTRVYLVALCIVDQLALCMQGIVQPLLEGLPSLLLYVNHWHWGHRAFVLLNQDMLCRIRVYVGATLRVYSYCLVAAICVERVLIFTWRRVANGLTYTRSLTSALLLFLLATTTTLPTLLFHGEANMNGETVCVVRESAYVQERCLELCLHQLLPIATVAICMMLIAVQSRRRRLRALDLDQLATEEQSEAAASSWAPLNTGVIHGTGRLMAVAALFLLCTIPRLISDLALMLAKLNCPRSVRVDLHADAYALSLLILCVNYSCKFLLYCLLRQRFLHQAKALCRCRYGEYRQLSEHRHRLSRPPPQRHLATATTSSSGNAAAAVVVVLVSTSDSEESASELSGPPTHFYRRLRMAFR